MKATAFEKEVVGARGKRRGFSPGAA